MTRELTNKQKAEQLALLKLHPGWEIMSEILSENVRIIAEQILDDIDSSLDPKLKERLVLKRYFQDKLVKMPDLLIKKLSVETVQNDVEFDPFD